MKSNQPKYAVGAREFANEPPLQVTLRVMHIIFSSPRTWLGFAAVIAILVITGPFDTLEDLPFAERVVYWAGVSLVTFPLGLSCSVYFGTLFYQRGMPEVVSRLIGGAIGGLPIGLFVFLVNKYMAGNDIGTLDDLLRLTGYTVIISTAISLIYFLVESSARERQAPQVPSAATPEQVPIPFFERLPKALGTDIICLQAQDHYVRATTTRGSEMVLIRLADAEKELEAVPGLRVHRSWWVADAHLEKLQRRDGKPVLVLDNGTEIPVSRTYMSEVRTHLELRKGGVAKAGV